MKQKFLFSHMKVHEKQQCAYFVDCSLISYLIPEMSMFKEPKHDTQNLFTANNNNNIQSYDVVRFAPLSLSYKINYNSTTTEILQTEG